MGHPCLHLSYLSERAPLEDDQVWELNGRMVEVRGFWHSANSETGVLSPAPNLKSCCIKAPSKIYQQIIVKGDFTPLDSCRAVALNGVFRIDPQKNERGDLIQFYILEQPREVPTGGAGYFLVGVFILASALAARMLFRWVKRKPG